jgi:two-component system chemotaxis response regulator CheB
VAALSMSSPPDGRPRADRPIRLMLVDDSIVARSVITRILETRPEFEIVDTASNAEQALARLDRHELDIVLLDLEMPGMDGLTALPHLLERSRGARVLIVSSAAGEGAAATVKALTLGAADTLLKPGTGGFGNRFADMLVERLLRIGHAERRTTAAARPAGGIEPPPRSRSLPIECLAIGASTGGLHALSAFFRALPAAFDAPILVTQHLPAVFMPYFCAQMQDISGRKASLAADGSRLQRGELLIAPGDGHIKLVRTRNGVLVRLDRAPAVSGCFPSVDPMLASLAEAFGPAGVGVVLSGMGRDGVHGAAALVAAGGEVFVQDAESSVVWGMPGAIANAGLAAGVMPADRIAQRLEMSPSATRIFETILEERTGQQLSANRRWRIETVLKPLMKERAIGSLDELATNVRNGANPALSARVVEALLNNETYFFRELQAFEQLVSGTIERFSASRAATRRLRIWSAGCSTGQEAYSLAMTFAEAAERWAGWTIEILGTDVSRGAIDRARAGLYSQFEIQRGLPIRQMMRWFEPEPDEQWRALPALRDKVRFQIHNLLDVSPSPLRFDIILCRNVLLYFSSATRGAVFSRLDAAIARDGALMLGAGETVMGQTELFEPDLLNRGLYRPV